MNKTEQSLEQDYKDLSNLLSNIVNTIPMYLFVKDTGNDFRYMYSSPMMNTLYGRYHNDVVGKTDFDLFSDPFTAQAFRNKDLEILNTGQMQHFVEHMIDPQGMLHSIDTIKALVPREGKQPFLLGLSWDITQQKQIDDELHRYNKRLAMACQAGHIYPWVWDMISNTAEISVVEDGQIKNILITHESFVDKIHPDDQQMYHEKTIQFISGKTDTIRCCFRCDFFTEDYVWYEKIGEVYEYDENQRPYKSIGILRDISADKQHEADMRAKELAEESNRMKSAFIANMSHEIRTPLNAIVGFSTLLAQSDSEEEKKEYLNVIESSNDFLLQLIGDILDISKIESGKLEFIYTSFSLKELFAPQVHSFALRVSPGVNLIFETEAPDYKIISEKTRLTQVIVNFLSNAAKFTTEGSIRFGYKIIEKGIYVYVTDTGMGIPEDKQSSIFDRFVKLNNFKQGTGLGLSICKTIVTILNGEIGITSEEGKGSTFWFTIPCHPIRVD